VAATTKYLPALDAVRICEELSGLIAVFLALAGLRTIAHIRAKRRTAEEKTVISSLNASIAAFFTFVYHFVEATVDAVAGAMVANWLFVRR
jgi:hypothetical protein